MKPIRQFQGGADIISVACVQHTSKDGVRIWPKQRLKVKAAGKSSTTLFAKRTMCILTHDQRRARRVGSMNLPGSWVSKNCEERHLLDLLEGPHVTQRSMTTFSLPNPSVAQMGHPRDSSPHGCWSLLLYTSSEPGLSSATNLPPRPDLLRSDRHHQHRRHRLIRPYQKSCLWTWSSSAPGSQLASSSTDLFPPSGPPTHVLPRG